MTKPLKQKKVKAWAVINTIGVVSGVMLDQDADCACHSMTYYVPSIFSKKRDAMDYKTYSQEVIPCTITYSLPTNKKKK